MGWAELEQDKCKQNFKKKISAENTSGNTWVSICIFKK
jgi:hypothetical protein